MYYAQDISVRITCPFGLNLFKKISERNTAHRLSTLKLIFHVFQEEKLYINTKIFLYAEKKILQIKASVEECEIRLRITSFSVNGYVFTLSLFGLLLQRGYDSTFLGSQLHREPDIIVGCEGRRAPVLLSVCSNIFHVYLGQTTFTLNVDTIYGKIWRRNIVN
jgi:hypothetical protein